MNQALHQATSRHVSQIVKHLALLLLRGYKLVISPVLPVACRFYPTCSEYAMQAIEQHGVLRGFWLAVKRITRCHPWNAGGYDPVPQHTSQDGSQHESQHHPQTCCKL
jgi:hypothetical protein